MQDTVEGAGENRCFGPQNRIAGTLVWISDLREVKKAESGGGKAGGGSGGEFITYQYFVHLMVGLCRARTPISRVPKIWSDGKLFFSTDTDITLSSNGIDTKIFSSVVYVFGSANPITHNYMLFESDISLGRPDLSKFKSGGQVTVSGYPAPQFTDLLLVATPAVGATTLSLKAGASRLLAVDDVLEFTGWAGSYSVQTGVTVTTSATTVTIKNTVVSDRPIGTATFPAACVAKRGSQANSGIFTVSAATKDPDPSGTQISQVRLTDASNLYRKFAAVSIGGATVVVSQTNPNFKASQVGQVFILTGGPDQAVPQILQQVEGGNVSQVYAMRNRAGFVLQDVNLTDSGNRVANYEAFLEVTADPQLVSDAIKTLLTDDAEWPENGIDVSLVSSSSTVLGYTVKGPTPPRQSLAPLLMVHDVVQWETAGKLYFATRSNLPTTTIPVADIGAYDPQDQGGKRGLVVQDPPREFMPSEVVVSYRSPTNDLQTATKRSPRTEEAPPNPRQINLPDMVLDDDHAQQFADRLMALAWGAARTLVFPLSQSYAGVVRAGMILSFGPVYGQNWKCITKQVDRGANMLLQVTGQEHDPNLLVQTQTTEGTLGLSVSGNSQDGGHFEQPPAELFLLDTPALSDQHRKEPGVYVAARSSDPARPWRGAILYWSLDGGSTWNRIMDVLTEAMTGEVVTPPSVMVLPGMWDRANTIRVVIRHSQAQLGSVSEEACLAGSNRFLVGREIVGAANVAFVSYDPVEMTKTYDLSTLLRGQQDTDQHMDEHMVAGESVVWLDGPGIQYLPLSYSHVYNARTWKLVPHGGFVEDASAVTFAPAARAMRPYHVRDAAGTRDGSNNLSLTWERQTRAARIFAEQGEPLDEEVEAYEIDVVVSGIVKRTISVSGSRTATYSAANQTTDGATLGGPVTLRFYQVSAGLLRGQESEYSI